MCRNECRTFLWKGDGQPTHSADGRCWCICEDETWSDRNILGRAACVPHVAHTTFGWAGLVLSVCVLCHAVHHLRRQVRVVGSELTGVLLGAGGMKKKRLKKMNFVHWDARLSEIETVGELRAALLFAYRRNDNL